MTKKRSSRSHKKAKKNGIMYLFLIPVLFLAVYLTGQPQTLLQQANTNSNFKAQVAQVAPTFTSIGDCVANNNCPPTVPLPKEEQQSIPTEPTVNNVQPIQVETKEKREKNEKGERAQLIEKIQELLKEITNGKCEGKADALNSNYAGGDDIQANRHGHRRKKWKNKSGLWKLLKCLKKNGGEHKQNPVGGAPAEP